MHCRARGRSDQEFSWGFGVLVPMAAVCDPATSHLGSLAFPPGGQGRGVLCGPSGSQSLQALWTWTWGRCFLITVPLPLLPQWWAEPYYPSPESLAPQFKGERFVFFFSSLFFFPVYSDLHLCSADYSLLSLPLQNKAFVPRGWGCSSPLPVLPQ